MGYFKDEDIVPKGWEKWCGKRERERYKEVRLACRKCLFTLAKYNLSFYSRNPLDTRKPDPYWIKFLDKRMREKNEELDTLKELKKVSHGTTENWLARGRIASIELKKCKEDYEEIEKGWEEERFDPWVLVTNERILKNEELFALKELKCVSRFGNKHGMNMLRYIGRIEKRKSEKKFDKLMKMFSRWESKRPNTIVVNKTVNYNQPINVRRETTAPWGKKYVIKSHVPHYFPGFHPVRSGFAFGY